MIYYLMNCEPERRMIIDSATRSNCEVCQTTEADSWIEAKRKLGFELTWLQEQLAQNGLRHAA